MDNQSIAAELHVAEATVKTHVRQILGKLGVASRTQAALLAHGILPRARRSR
jgi:DNA-binding NarL/FixJ family response regulator